LAVMKRRRLEHQKEEDIAVKKKAMVGTDTHGNAKTVTAVSVQEAAEIVGHSDDEVEPVTHSQAVMTMTSRPTASASNSEGVSTAPTTTSNQMSQFVSDHATAKGLFRNNPTAQLLTGNPRSKPKTEASTSQLAQPPANISFWQTPEIQDHLSRPNNALPPHVLAVTGSRVQLSHEIKLPVLSSMDGACSVAISEEPASRVEAFDDVEPYLGVPLLNT